MQKKERKNKKSNNLTSNLLQKETQTHTHTQNTQRSRWRTKRTNRKKRKRDLESCGVVTQIEKAKRIFANPRETTKEILFYFLVLHYNVFIIIKEDYLPVQKKKKNKKKKTCCNSLPPAATGAAKATRWSSNTKASIALCVCVCVCGRGSRHSARVVLSSLSLCVSLFALRFFSELHSTTKTRERRQQ